MVVLWVFRVARFVQWFCHGLLVTAIVWWVFSVAGFVRWFCRGSLVGGGYGSLVELSCATFS